MSDYTKLRVVGKGSYGVVELLRRKNDRSLFVMKKIETSSSSNRDEALKEVQLLRDLDHPNIVGFVEAFYSPSKQLCIVMEYCDSGDLDQYVEELKKSKKLMSPDQLSDYFLQLTLALKYLHSNHIIHRDLKPQNVFLSNRRRMIKLGDFGITKTLENTCAMAVTRIGTPYYFSPELCRNRPYGYKSDIWALGVITYQMMCRKLPFEARDMPELIDMVLNRKPQSPPREYDKDFRGLLAKMLSKSPNIRPSAAQLLSADVFRSKMQEIVARYSSANGRAESLNRHAMDSQPNAEPTVTTTKEATAEGHKVVTKVEGAPAPAPAAAPAAASSSNGATSELEDLVNKQAELEGQLKQKRDDAAKKVAEKQQNEAEMGGVMKGGDLAAQLAAAKEMQAAGERPAEEQGKEATDAEIKWLEEQLVSNHEQIHEQEQVGKEDGKFDRLVKTVTAELGVEIEKYAPPDSEDYKDEDGIGIQGDGYGGEQPVVAAAKADEIVQK
jgi:NIMA (never in mitosis gene a)-related kinase